MGLGRFRIENFRRVEAAEVEFDARCNLISGPNASGKTSVLEAIYFLGRGRSFRASRNEALIRTGTGALLLAGQLERRPGHPFPIGVHYTREGFEARVAGERIHSLAELAASFPVQAIDPDVHQLIEEGPQARRRYLDWGVFHVEPSYVGVWRRYQRALRQRNAALRQHASEASVRAWDPELVESGIRLHESRTRYLEWLRPEVANAGVELLDEPVELDLLHGWARDSTFGDALAKAWPRERERQTTLVGPHRADLAIQVGGQPARHRVSRGQQKLTAAAMLLGQLRCDQKQGSPTAALLVDDPAAELDSEHLGRLISLLAELPAQLFVTALDPSVAALRQLPDPRMFHVEHGKIAPLVYSRVP